jgi:phosphoribosylamine-glycine ligase
MMDRLSDHGSEISAPLLQMTYRSNPHLEDKPDIIELNVKFSCPSSPEVMYVYMKNLEELIKNI